MVECLPNKHTAQSLTPASIKPSIVAQDHNPSTRETKDGKFKTHPPLQFEFEANLGYRRLKERKERKETERREIDKVFQMEKAHEVPDSIRKKNKLTTFW